MALSEQLHPSRGSARTPIIGLGRAIGQAISRSELRRSRLPLPVVLYLLAVFVPISFNLGSLMITGARLVLILMILPMTYQLIMGRYGRLLVTDVFFFLHLGWATVAMAVNNPEQVVTNMGSTGIEFLGGYMLARAYIRTPDEFVALVRWLGIVVLILAPFAIFETMTGRPLILETLRHLPGISTFANVNADPRMGLERVQTVFAHPIHSGLFFAFTYGLTFVGLKGVLSDKLRYIISATAGFCAFLALSSGALLAMVLITMLIFWAWAWGANTRKWWILFGVFVLLYILIDLLSNRTPMRVFLAYATFSSQTAYNRSVIFDWGMINVWANPLYGIGLNDWERPKWMHSGSMDNFWLVMAVRYGIPGFVTLAIGYLVALVGIGLRNFRGDPLLLDLRKAWMICMVGMTFTLCTVHVWHTIYSFVFFIFGSGMWMLQAKPGGAQITAAAHPGEEVIPSRGGFVQRRGMTPAPSERIIPQREAGPVRIDNAPERLAMLPVGGSSRVERNRYSRFPPHGRKPTKSR